MEQYRRIGDEKQTVFCGWQSLIVCFLHVRSVTIKDEFIVCKGWQTPRRLSTFSTVSLLVMTGFGETKGWTVIQRWLSAPLDQISHHIVIVKSDLVVLKRSPNGFVIWLLGSKRSVREMASHTSLCLLFTVVVLQYNKLNLNVKLKLTFE